MIEVMIECWRAPDTGETFRWSVWFEGRRIGMGGPHASSAQSEREAVALCERKLGQRPNRITRL